jgi:hypothetical protein
MTAVLFCRCHGGRLQTPPPATGRARSASGPLGVRKQPRRRLPDTARASGTRGLRSDRPPMAPALKTPTSGLRQRSPNRIPGWWSGSCGPRGGRATTLPFATKLHRLLHQTRKLDLQAQPRGLREGGLPSAPRVERRSLRRLRVPSGRRAVGCRWRGLFANSEGTPPRDVSARSQPEELRAAARGDAQGPKAAYPRGKKELFTK